MKTLNTSLILIFLLLLTPASFAQRNRKQIFYEPVHLGGDPEYTPRKTSKKQTPQKTTKEATKEVAPTTPTQTRTTTTVTTTETINTPVVPATPPVNAPVINTPPVSNTIPLATPPVQTTAPVQNTPTSVAPTNNNPAINSTNTPIDQNLRALPPGTDNTTSTNAPIPSQANQVDQTKTVASNEETDDRSYTEKMVDFIKGLMGEKPQPIDESLLRDGQKKGNL